eukprot:gene8094-12555_t
MNRKSSSFNVSKYSIQFNCVLEHKDIQDCFYNFLKTEYNTEPLDCVLEIDHLKTLKTDTEKILKCNQIIEEFIKSTGKREINIAGETKLKLFHDFGSQLEEKKWMLKETAFEIFYPIRKILLAELRADNFPRFVRTKEFSEVIKNYCDDPKVMVLSAVTKYPFTDEHFENQFVSNKEMEFMQDVLQDSFNWDSIYSKNHLNVYSSNNSSTAFRFETILPYSFEKSVIFFLSIKNLMQLEPEITDISIREKVFSKYLKHEDVGNPYYFLIGEISQMSGFPFNTPRKSIDVFNIDFDYENELLTFCKRPYIGDFKGKNIDFDKKMKFNHTDKKKQTKEVNGFFVNQFLTVNMEIIDPYTTKISFSMMFDSKGLMQYGEKLLPMIASFFGSHIEKFLLKTIKDAKIDQTIESFQDNENEPFLQLANLILKDKIKKKETDHLYSDSNLKIPFIFDFEYDYFSKIINSSLHWESHSTSGNSKIYLSNSNFIPNSEFFKDAVNVMIKRDVKVPFEIVIKCTLSYKNRKEVEHTQTFYGMKETVYPLEMKLKYPNMKCQDYPCFISEIHSKLPFPLNTPRKSIMVEGLKFIDENTLIFLSRPYIGDFILKDNIDFNKKMKFNYYPDFKTNKEIEVEGYIIPQLLFTKIEKIDDEKTSITEVMMMDARGGSLQNAGKHIMKMSTGIFLKIYVQQMNEYFEKTPKDFTFTASQIEKEEAILKLVKSILSEKK